MTVFQFSRWLAVGIICMLAVRAAQAGPGFQPPSPEELKMTSEPMAPGVPAIILYRQVDRDDNVHTPHEDNYFRIKILTEEGRKNADVEIPFLKEGANVVNIRARTIRSDGSTVDFGGKVFEKNLVKGRGLRYMAKTFTLPDVQVGGIIEYYYTIDYHEMMLYDSHWTLSDEMFTKKARFSLKPFSDNYYGNYSLRWSWNTLPAGTAPPKEGPDHIIRMESNNIAAFPQEDYMPPPDDMKARVDFIYEQGNGEKDQAGFWKHVGKERNAQMESFIGKRNAMEAAVGQIVSPSDPQDVKLRKIYDRVQKLRNTSFEVRKTEQEQKRDKEKEMANVEDIWKRGYGNGQQLTWLFLALTRAAGFEAYGCWVSSRSEYFFSPVTMQSTKLNQNVVLVKLNGQDLYLDPGDPFTPFGLLEWSETGVPGLRMDRDGGTWITTTLPHAAESRVERVGKLKLSDTGDMEGKLTITYTGLEAMYIRLGERHADDVEHKKFLEERATASIAAAAEAELTNKPDWTSSQTPLVAEFNLKIPGWASNAGSRVVIPAAVFTAGEKGIFEHADRVHPIYFEYPYEKVDDVTLEMPAGWQVSSMPAEQNRDAHVILYNLKVEKNAGDLRLLRKLSVDFMILDPKYYGALRAFFQAVRIGDGEQVILQPGEIHASN